MCRRFVCPGQRDRARLRIGAGGWSVICLQELQQGNINVQVHLLTNIGIARTEGLDFRVGQRLLVNILGGANRALARHDLPDELLLVLHQLIQIAVKSVLRHIGIDLHLRILVALTDDPTFPLGQISRSVFAYSKNVCNK